MFEMIQMNIYTFERNEINMVGSRGNIVTKGEIAAQQQFLPLPQCFKILAPTTHVKTRPYEVMG